MTYKSESFKNELPYIQDETIRLFAINAIETIPDYFFTVGASSTGKYHPNYAAGEGGLLRHTRAAIRIAMELLRLDWWHFTQREIDLMLVSLMLHDGWKHGVIQAKFTVADHPNIAVKSISNNNKLLLSTTLPSFDIAFILANLESHMGQWNFDYKTKEVILKKPVDKFQKFVHLCDYLASRKCLEMNFEAELSK